MAGSRSITSILQLATLFMSLLLNISYVEARRRSSRYRHNTSNGFSHKRGNDPLPWWAITFIFVGGVLGLFICIMALKKIYEKKRKQKIRVMLSRRSTNLQRRRSLQNTTIDEPHQGSGPAPPSYEQSAKDDAQPPAYTYSKDVNTADEHAMPPPTPQATSVAMGTPDPALAPPSYDVAQTDGSEVVEVGGAVSMETSTTDGDQSIAEV